MINRGTRKNDYNLALFCRPTSTLLFSNFVLIFFFVVSFGAANIIYWLCLSFCQRFVCPSIDRSICRRLWFIPWPWLEEQESVGHTVRFDALLCMLMMASKLKRIVNSSAPTSSSCLPPPALPIDGQRIIYRTEMCHMTLFSFAWNWLKSISGIYRPSEERLIHFLCFTWQSMLRRSSPLFPLPIVLSDDRWGSLRWSCDNQHNIIR